MTKFKVNLCSFFEQFLPNSICLLCRNPAKRPLPLCNGCEQDLPRLDFHCHRCAEPLATLAANPLINQSKPVLASEASYRICGRCLKQPPAFDRTLAPLRYDFPVNWLIQNYKHRFDHLSFAILSHLLLNHLRQQYSDSASWPDQLMPVPLHRQRLYQRGFNQAAELARWLGSQLSLPVNTRACQRQLNTPQQQGLSAKQRRRNLRKAFYIDTQQLAARGHYRHIALIDDVFTTGSTAQAIAAQLKKAGVERIDVWCLARTPKQQDKG